MKTYTKDIVTIGQVWQRKPRSSWRVGLLRERGERLIDLDLLKVRNVYRHEESVLVLGGQGEKEILAFRELRKYYRLLGQQR